jgi:hypothetical protein
MALCRRCEGMTKDGNRCRFRVPCNGGAGAKRRTRCSIHKGGPKYTSRKSAARKSVRRGSEHRKPEDWPDNLYFPEGGKFPKPPKEFPRNPTWRNLSNRIYADVDCGSLANEDPGQCRYHYKCTSDCGTREGFEASQFKEYNDDPFNSGSVAPSGRPTGWFGGLL